LANSTPAAASARNNNFFIMSPGSRGWMNLWA
jgi:hypothetical protein